MPISYAMMDEEEMMYLEGGVVYRGSFSLALGFTACVALGSYNAACLITALQLYDIYGGFNIDEVDIFRDYFFKSIRYNYNDF